MRLVQQAALRPHRCAAVPFIGNSTAKQGFIDTGQSLPGWDPHVYLSVEAVQQMARMIGWQPQVVTRGYQDQVAELKRKLEAERDEIKKLTEQLDAVRVLKNAGFAQANPPGRPRKVAA